MKKQEAIEYAEYFSGSFDHVVHILMVGEEFVPVVDIDMKPEEEESIVESYIWGGKQIY